MFTLKYDFCEDVTSMCAVVNGPTTAPNKQRKLAQQ